MSYLLDKRDGKMVVKLAGDLYVKSVAELREELLALISAQNYTYVFDMSELRYIDSAGLGLLITVQKRVVPHGGEVRIRGLQGVIKELFEQTRLDKVFVIE